MSGRTLCAIAIMLASCGDPSSIDGGADAPSGDAGTFMDAAIRDAGPNDAASSDSGSLPDATSMDAASVDAASVDASVDASADAASIDAALPPDAAGPDASSADASSFDAGFDASAMLDAGSLDAATLDAGPGEPRPPRPISPLSTATVTSRRPTLRWELAGGTDGARVELCSDRACTTLLETIDATGASAAPTLDLPVGVVFWRLRGRDGAIVGSTTSPTWQMTVRGSPASTDTWWGTVFDANGDGFGDIAVGAYGAARAHVFHGSTAGLIVTPATSLTGAAGGRFGTSVASAGDMNGDGYADLIVGAPLEGGGRAYVYLGGPSGIATSPGSTLVGPDGGSFGGLVAYAGDVDDDGYADVLVSAPGTAAAAGSVYVYLGPPAYTFTGASPDAYFGILAESVGDLDGDGNEDLVITAPYPLENTMAHTFVFLAFDGGLSTPIRLDGSNVVGGDFDGDGYAELIVDRAIHPGGPGWMPATSPVVIPFGNPSAGYFHAEAGDVDGDGYWDLVTGNPGAIDSGTGRQAGVAFVYFGDASAPLTTRLRLNPLLPTADLSNFGASASGAGDTNGDGYADVVVGASTHGYPFSDGAVYVLRGTAGSLPFPWWNPLINGPDGSGGNFGISVE